MYKIFFLLIAATLCSLCSGVAAAQSAKPIEIDNDVPQTPVSELYRQNKNWPQEREAQIAYGQGMLDEGIALLEEYAEASAATLNGDLLFRRVLLPIAERLYQIDPSEAHKQQLISIADQVAQSPVYEAHAIHAEKVHAAVLVARLSMLDHQNNLVIDPEQADKLIQGIIDAFPARQDEDGPGLVHTYPGTAHAQAMRLAQQAGRLSQAEAILKVIEENPIYMQAPGVVQAMAEAGSGPVFELSAPTVSGQSFAMPRDTRGKVVVVDFWATWCGPCVASMPHLKELHEAYADRGVVFVGVSADRIESDESLAQLRRFVESREYDWTHLYYREWPGCAVAYGVGSLPTVMVIGKDGRVQNANARFDLQRAIDQALAQE